MSSLTQNLSFLLFLENQSGLPSRASLFRAMRVTLMELLSVHTIWYTTPPYGLWQDG